VWFSLIKYLGSITVLTELFRRQRNDINTLPKLFWYRINYSGQCRNYLSYIKLITLEIALTKVPCDPAGLVIHRHGPQTLFEPTTNIGVWLPMIAPMHIRMISSEPCGCEYVNSYHLKVHITQGDILVSFWCERFDHYTYHPRSGIILITRISILVSTWSISGSVRGLYGDTVILRVPRDVSSHQQEE
jgi:hypothetical protein